MNKAETTSIILHTWHDKADEQSKDAAPRRRSEARRAGKFAAGRGG